MPTAAKKQYGLIFDMDNTILASKIDFNRMKQEVLAFLNQRLTLKLPPPPLSTGQLIQLAADQGLGEADQKAAWQLVGAIEEEGMIAAQAQAGAQAALQTLALGFQQVVLTNNTYSAAKIALQATDLEQFFSHIYAREQVPHLKPKPGGIYQIQKTHPHIQKWLLIGDSWLDGQAAFQANLPFAAYGHKTPRYWQDYQITPDLILKKWDQYSVLCISRWF